MDNPSKIGDIVRIFMGRIGLTQAQLARNVGCGKGMINHILSEREVPGVELAWKMAEEIAETQAERETVAFYLLGHHNTLDSIESDFPNAFKSYRTSGDRQDDEDTEVHE